MAATILPLGPPPIDAGQVVRRGLPAARQAMGLIFTLYIGRRHLQSGNDTLLAGGKPATGGMECIEFSNGKIDRLYGRVEIRCRSWGLLPRGKETGYFPTSSRKSRMAWHVPWGRPLAANRMARACTCRSGLWPRTAWPGLCACRSGLWPRTGFRRALRGQRPLLQAHVNQRSSNPEYNKERQ
jgi:hypothetical protein